MFDMLSTDSQLLCLLYLQATAVRLNVSIMEDVRYPTMDHPSVFANLPAHSYSSLFVEVMANIMQISVFWSINLARLRR